MPQWFSAPGGRAGQKILGFNLPPVITMTWQPELGSRVWWRPGLMIRCKWEQRQRGWSRDEEIGRDGQGVVVEGARWNLCLQISRKTPIKGVSWGSRSQREEVELS